MAAFGQTQGGKASAHESQPIQADNPGNSEGQGGQCVAPQVSPGHGGSRCGFGC